MKCLPINWKSKEQQAFFINKKDAKRLEPETDYELFLTDAEVNKFNKELTDYKNDIRNTEDRFKLDGITYTLSMVLESSAAKKKPNAKKEDPGKSVVAFIEQFTKESKVTHKAGTLKVYTGLAAHLKAFQTNTGRKAHFER